MNLETQLYSLQHRVSSALRQFPGATALYLRGSRASGHTDGYADLDLQVYSDTLVTDDMWPQFLERVEPMEIAWPLTGAAHVAVFTIIFRFESYYHKVDIGLSHGEADTTTETGVRIWSQAAAPEIAWAPSAGVYLPAFGSIGYQIFDELFASERYLKARMRCQHLLCWRFIRVQPDHWLHLLRSLRLGLWTPGQLLTTWELKALEAALTIDERLQFSSHLAWSDPAAMDANMLWFTTENVRLLTAQALVLREPLPDDQIRRHLEFIRNELAVSKPIF